jgi:hypothetical protein
VENNEFDALARRLARAHSRRSMLKNLGAVALGAMGLARISGVEAKPSCRNEGHPCEGNQTCCDGLACIASGPGSALRCTVCPTGTTLVDGACVSESACDDGIQNGDETDVDCGGSCAPCADGKMCLGDQDCASGHCEGGGCAAAETCSDLIKNGSETDVDCGGGACPPCADGKTCVIDSDCESGHCIDSSCSPCAANQTPCGGACVDTTSDENNCGGCGNICTPGPNVAAMICEQSICKIAGCNDGFADCDDIVESGCETDLRTPVNCGACGNVCPGYMQPNDNVTCQSGGCTFSCQGEHYDVDGDMSNGCEVSADPQGHHTIGSASSLGDLSCNDITQTLTGSLPSDARVHASPAIVGFDVTTGSAPVWYTAHATGGSVCTNDLAATLTISNSTHLNCYQLQVIAGINTFTAQTNGSGTATITQGSGAYHEDDDISFRIAKTCGTNVTEAANYSLEFHL